jgi:hypothetical protein
MPQVQQQANISIMGSSGQQESKSLPGVAVTEFQRQCVCVFVWVWRLVSTGRDGLMGVVRVVESSIPFDRGQCSVAAAWVSTLSVILHNPMAIVAFQPPAGCFTWRLFS